jgi:hypothetical protein
MKDEGTVIEAVRTDTCPPIFLKKMYGLDEKIVAVRRFSEK